ncbi:MAG TPA: 30S ribosomal protein S1, partial [Firmicutes bacterium]|nr:30S ribosomal protein S1 [Bacillota bacterium]
DINEDEGIIILSKKELDREQAWLKLKEALDNNITMKGRVKDAVPAGIIIALDAGLEGFMPGSLVDFKYIPDFKELIGKEMEFKVIEINRERAKIILSKKKVLEEEQEKKKTDTLNRIKEGDIISGEVKRLTDFGAFVDVGGIDGLVHISEISWKRIGHPREVLSVGEEVSVKVLEVIPEKERIGLSIRQARPDPWSLVATKCAVGDIMQGTVTRIVNFGAFVEIFPGVEGLVHISQLADYHVKHPSEVLQEQQDVRVKILDINPEAKRISLSIKEAQEKSAGENNASHYEAREDAGVTLGDVFGDLFGNDKNSDQE